MLSVHLRIITGVSAFVKIKTRLLELCCHHLVKGLWETIIQSWPWIKTWMVKTVLGAVKTNLTPVSHKSLTITEDGDSILISFHESPPLIQLIVPQDGIEVCPLSSPVALCRTYYLLLWLHSSLRPECRMGLMTQAPHRAIISLGPVDWGKTYPSLCFYVCLSPHFSHSFLFWVSRCAMT